MKIEEKNIERPYKKMVKPAAMKDIDTGEKREVTIIKEDGQRVVEERAITRRVHYEAVTEDAVLQQKVFSVKTITKATGDRMIKTKGGLLVKELEEEHHFASREDAERFIEDSRKDRA